MYTEGKLSEKDYRMWFMLNNMTRISILTPVGETDNTTIMNGIGQGSFAGALASSNNIGTSVYDITKEEVSANIANMPLNCLIFQERYRKDEPDTRGCMKRSREDIGRIVESKQLKANVSKSKFVEIGSKKSRKKCLKRAEKNPIKMGDLILENSTAEKYLGDKIHEDGTAARITKTIKSRMPAANAKSKEIMRTTKSTLWLLWLKMNWRIIKLKLRAITKTMGKSKDNLCRQALINGQETCNGEDLLTKCMNICKT